MKKINSSARYGSFSLAVTAIILVILIFVNLAINALPATVTSVTGEKTDVYKVSDATKKYLKTVEDDITVYVVHREGTVTENELIVEQNVMFDPASAIKKYVERYAALSDKLTVKYVDPEIKPGFLDAHNTDSAVSKDALGLYSTHLVVETEKRSKLIPFTDIFALALSSQDDLDAFYQAYGYIPYNYRIESALLNAIDYVTVDVLPTIYYTNTHKENVLDDGFNDFAKLENIGLSALDIEKEGKVPSEAQAVIIYAPETDFSEREIQALKEYADNGGKVILSTEYNINLADRYLDNLYGFTKEYYGMDCIDAFVMEGSKSNIYQLPIYILATMTDKVPSVIKTKQGYALFTYSHGIDIADTLPEGVTVDKLFTTTSAGYARPNFGKEDTVDKKDSDLSGTFVLGATATRVSGDTKSKLWWFSTTDAISTDMNPYIAVYVLADSVDKKESVSASAIVITHELMDISDKAATFWSWIIIAIIPASVLGYGIYVRARRVRR